MLALSALPIGQQAEWLVREYAPTATLSLVYAGRWSSYSHRPLRLSGACEIRWRPTDGTTILLHEIGHVALGHHRHMPMLRSTFSKAEETMFEAAAWRWAERAARKMRLPFDYRHAEACFRTYTAAVAVTWRWRPTTTTT